jgi:DNA sulfur modification protein DndB
VIGALVAVQDMIDKERITIPLRSHKLFTLSTLYDANEELLGDKIDKRGSSGYEAKLTLAIEYWSEVATVISDWRKVKNEELRAPQLRQEKINTHAVVMRALGGLGRTLIEEYPKDWKAKLQKLKTIDWRKAVGNKVNPLWDNVCITAGSVVSNRQARAETLTLLKNHLGLGSSDRKVRAAS